ncbi:translation initiation factor [Hoyosella rhizosphaerae]|uniref:Translation initiation factor n=1 Tax=Hoyosella rhizosphaerae TaxID=1755582 RepID=A0A916U7U2_9ACTN|nr:translation initiation factor [Hoyosella rhizosphaerae]GGC62939.1 hypothetical protein GCM10011410_14200 [Hoyosella rhizosphaerae]
MATTYEHLTGEELAQIAAGLAEGKRVTVFLREPIVGLGLAAGASARVISVDGSSVLVKPAGVDDEIPFEAHELRRTRKAPEPPKRKPRAKSVSTSRAPAPKKQTPAPKPVPATQPAPTPQPAPAEAARKAPVPPKRSVETAPSKTAPSKTAKKSAECAISLRADADGAWSIEVDRPGGLSLKPASVSPDAVLRAIEQLDHPGALRAAQAALNAARQAAERRVADLRKELAEAQSALDALSGS